MMLTNEQKTKLFKIYERECKCFVKNGAPIVFSRLEGMQAFATELGLGDFFKPIRDQYMDAIKKQCTSNNHE